MSPRTPSPTDHVRSAHKYPSSPPPHATLQLSNDLQLPVEAVTETFAILAKRGAGKTYIAAVMVEELLQAGLQVVVADPVGVWWGLRASADGQQEGLPIVIIGGEHGDVPLEVGAGEIIADGFVNLLPGKYVGWQ
jgi:DNA helicase HerA-like ATPase